MCCMCISVNIFESIKLHTEVTTGTKENQLGPEGATMLDSKDVTSFFLSGFHLATQQATLQQTHTRKDPSKQETSSHVVMKVPASRQASRRFFSLKLRAARGCRQ